MQRMNLRLDYKYVKLRHLSWVCSLWDLSWPDWLSGKGIMTPRWKAWTPAKQVLHNHWLGYLCDLAGERPISILFCILLYIKTIEMYHIRLIDTWIYQKKINITISSSIFINRSDFRWANMWKRKIPIISELNFTYMSLFIIKFLKCPKC